MRLNTKKLLQLLLAVFLVCVVYLNLNITDINTDTRQMNGALPWGDNFNKGKRPSLVYDSKRIHDHVFTVRNVSPNASKHEETFGFASADHHHHHHRGHDLANSVYPSALHYSDDRIQKQLKFVSESVRQQEEVRRSSTLVKKILVYSGTGSWRIPRGMALFKEQECAVQACELVDDRSKMKEADVVLFQSPPPHVSDRPPSQVWAIYLLESPYHSTSLAGSRRVFNWTATYRHDSTIVAPYEKYVPLNTSMLTRKPTRNYAQGKGKKVAWFVSNCGARNRRRQYADELSKYIQVDIYGACGSLKCPRFQNDKCFGMLNSDYKFYLAFENSNCRDYITEKFFINGLKHDVIPIVMGAAPEDYRRAAPPHSFIHVDDFESPEELAAYLHKLDQNDDLYNEYFTWKGLWDNINTFFWCRMCAMAHDVSRRGPSVYTDAEKWWRGPDVCIGQDNWRQRPRTNILIGDLPV